MTTLSPMRSGRITGSRIPKILGLSNLGNAETVMREMVRQAWGEPDEFTGNAFTDWGNEHEADGIAAYERERGVTVVGAQQFIPHPEYDWIGISPDGQITGLVGATTIEEGDGLVEVKCPVRRRYSHVREVPDIQAQMQAQMACTGRDWNDLMVWRGDTNYAISRLERDPWWVEQNFPALSKFHNRYLSIMADPELTAPYLEPLVDYRSDPEWAEAAADFLELKADADMAKQLVEDAKARLGELAGGRKSRGYGVQVLVFDKKGNVQWDKVLADKGIAPLTDAEKDEYRAKSRTETHVKSAVEK